MTLLWQRPKISFSANIFVVAEHNKYHFNGATLNITSNRWKKNNYRFNSYYALFPNMGIGFYKKHDQACFELLHDGRIVATVCVPASEKVGIDFLLSEMRPQSPDEFIMRDKLVQWYAVSNQTCRYLLGYWKDIRHQSVRIHIAGKQWMIQNSTLSQISLGVDSDVWGSISIEEQHLDALCSARVCPLDNGWLIEAGNWGRAVLIAERGNVDIKPLMFPFSDWKQKGLWRYWPTSRNVLTPRGHMIEVPVTLRSFSPEKHDKGFIIFGDGDRLFSVVDSGEDIFCILPAKSLPGQSSA